MPCNQQFRPGFPHVGNKIIVVTSTNREPHDVVYRSELSIYGFSEVQQFVWALPGVLFLSYP